MGKVINIFTRKEITELPLNKAQGEEMIEHLLKFEIKPLDMFSPMDEFIGHLVIMIENNSGASRFEVMDRIYGKIQV